MTLSTADLSDQHHPNLQYVAPIFRAFGGKNTMAGQVKTIKCFEDNSLVRETLSTAGCNRILVVDAGGSKRCAMLGDMIAELAVNNQWQGVLMYGLIRDARAIANMDLGVWALGTLPLKSVKLGVGQSDLTVHFGGVHIAPNDYLYADEDGILISNQNLSL